MSDNSIEGIKGSSIGGLIRSIQPRTARILEQALEGRDLEESGIIDLFSAKHGELLALLMVADHLRKETVGDVVTYVINRNINFTNVCVKRCHFCAFSRNHRSQEGYWLPLEEIVRRACEARDYGATEVCLQAGLPPDMQGNLYIRICQAIKDALPEVHIHAFSPEEILYGAQRSGMSISEYLRELKGAGLGSLPGTSAEILDDEVRALISPGRISTARWIEVVSTAHQLGIPTTSTIMYGHVESDYHCAKHLLLIRDLQRHTGGFTEFVPLSFVHSEAPLYTTVFRNRVRAGATGIQVLKMHAIARLVLNRDIPNIQASWVKDGTKVSQTCLAAGANDLGGTLVNESISSAAGARQGQLICPRELRRIIRDAGRIPAERSTLYESLRQFQPDEDDLFGPLDRLTSHETEAFGSYDQMIHRSDFRFSKG
ncbi:MAG: 5-amino-6-(D-ribitylamino)uracil--L-tyrosine 4-hydroxyphenyl transferase CofH [Acidobacteria bacterium]|nr:5-amino-6-(D-ribitylamino)uracil--L-tyrosine 4-hydroxyphenyl transferase CofH [Acidobacteriota bacterium]MCI0722498.1 5-amino-6-(D-ribitylamino)uracil--L-tyrosine 4-hydroxyphenyl transferase CofH [Acidobacteriota bacterium]